MKSNATSKVVLLLSVDNFNMLLSLARKISVSQTLPYFFKELIIKFEKPKHIKPKFFFDDPLPMAFRF